MQSLANPPYSLYNVPMDRVFQFRDAVNDDWELLLSWRNDPLTRIHSFSHEEIDAERHRSWLSEKLQDPGCRIVIISLNGTPVGVLRLDCIGSSATINYTVAPEARGKGCGTYIVGLAEKIAPECISVLEGTVLSDNPASQRCFARNGYQSVTHGDTCIFRKTIRS